MFIEERGREREGGEGERDGRKEENWNILFHHFYKHTDQKGRLK